MYVLSAFGSGDDTCCVVLDSLEVGDVGRVDNLKRVAVVQSRCYMGVDDIAALLFLSQDFVAASFIYGSIWTQRFIL